MYFRVRAALFDQTVRGARSPPHTSRRWDRQLRDKPETEIRGLLGNPQDTRQLRQTYSGRSARVATRPESQAAPPHKFNLPRRLSPPSHGSADRRLLTPGADVLRCFVDGIMPSTNLAEIGVLAKTLLNCSFLFSPNVLYYRWEKRRISNQCLR